MSALAWGTDVAYAATPGGQRRGSQPPASQRPHLVVLPGGAAEPSDSRGLRITARGRLALVVLIVALAAALGFAGLRSAGAAEPVRVVTVDTGQTLSEIAAAELPDHSISAGIVAIQVANGLSTAQVSAGQQLVIPGG